MHANEQLGMRIKIELPHDLVIAVTAVVASSMPSCIREQLMEKLNHAEILIAFVGPGWLLCPNSML
jgi:hypothetical protein